MSMVGYNLDPCYRTSIIIMLMAIAHSVQVFKDSRIVPGTGGPCQSDKKAAAVHTIGELFSPAALGISAEAAGILLVAWAPLPCCASVIHRTVWSMLALATACVLTPITWYLPGLARLRVSEMCWTAVMDWSGKVAADKRVRYWLVAALDHSPVCRCCILQSHLLIGETRPGTSILWPKDDYKCGLGANGYSFPGMLNPLAIYLRKRIRVPKRT